MKQYLSLITLLATLALSACTTVVEVEEVVLDRYSITLHPGDKSNLVASVYPKDATYDHITWSSDNSSVVTVQDGLLTALQPGTAQIKAFANGIYSQPCNVIVERILVSNIILNETSLYLDNGESFQLNASVSPSNATSNLVEFVSSNPTVASVTNDGLVTAKQSGRTTITCKSLDGNASASCDVFIEIIGFSDNNLKKYLVSLYDTNNDLELSYSEAAAVRSIGPLNNLKDIESFDEFQYFTGIQVVPDNWLKDCSKLKSIILPPSVAIVGTSAFENCTELTSINLNEGVMVKEKAFARTKLSGIVNVYCFSGGAFEGTSISDIYCYSSKPENYSDFDTCLQNLPERVVIHIRDSIFLLMDKAISIIAEYDDSYFVFISSGNAKIASFVASITAIGDRLTSYESIMSKVEAGLQDIEALAGLQNLGQEINYYSVQLSSVQASLRNSFAWYAYDNDQLSPFFNTIKRIRSERISQDNAAINQELAAIRTLLSTLRNRYDTLLKKYLSLLDSQKSGSVNMPLNPITDESTVLRSSSNDWLVNFFKANVVSFTP